MKKSLGVKIILLMVIAGVIVLFFLFDLDRYFSFVNLKSQLDFFEGYYRQHKALTMVMYMAVYILMAALSLPGAAVMTLAGGALFGLVYGTVLVSFASTTGATLAFLFSRYMFKDWVQHRFSSNLDAINKGMEKEGGFYLFALRLVPVFPFFVINLVMGLTALRTSVFYIVSQVGMLAGTIVYVNAGTHLAKIESAGGILSLKLIFSFVLLGIFPIIARRFISAVRQRKVFSKFIKPKKYEYNLVVIGAGSAGLVASYIAAAVKAKVALIEAHQMGGDCLNTGCVPSKALLAGAKLLSRVKRAEEYGFDKASVEFDFARVMERVQSVIKKVEPHDSVERYTGLGVDCIHGKAKIISPFEVCVNDKIFTTKNIIVATGANPMVPDLPGLEKINYLTSDTIWDIRTLPKKLLVLGAGPIGCELAQGFSRLGSNVTLVQRSGRIMKKEDPDAAQIILDRFQAEGITLFLNHSARAIDVLGEEKKLVCDHDGKEIKIPFDEILIALGRVPDVKGVGLEELGIELKGNQSIKTNEFLQTNFPNIYCCGDVHGRYQFTHTAAHESWYASVNALFGGFKKFRVDYSIIPWATFTDPEVARVGINETDANLAGIDYEMAKYGLGDLDRAIADSEDHGFVKVLTVPGKDRILGVTIVGHHAADVISEFVLAMKHGIGLNKILGTIHIYPTMAEANKYAAGLWKKTHAPKKLLAWVAKYHAWVRK
ncbi:FAD-dependent oxidoreductase [Desulfobacula phenolica]|uniref:Pyruvate/2-oxoglutarate dehydrogenase complex, dihydrolipoamide dehydrogenase (E3) component n=1 Tax=Desulfobacula phenolica TaxID=90732 RepID=A0A1H2JB45_9BACT|nr:bifunctional TVP38/TMEM64 family protein/FAD-dependent oxidoreductase [Desulfobacula phenolica]SDU53640.1 Pyruvate/2-oxoglutarate dehydrogenase complex, dihydrolipoamide dehydrogenase (E3) component [Desulfobacula phenolica]